MGWPLWELGSRKVSSASLDQSLKRMGLDYVDIFIIAVKWIPMLSLTISTAQYSVARQFMSDFPIMMERLKKATAI